MQPVAQTISRDRAIMLAVFIPLILMLIVFVLLCCLWNRYCKRVTKHTNEQELASEQTKIIGSNTEVSTSEIKLDLEVLKTHDD